MDRNSYFSATYDEARERFLAAAQQQDASVVHHQHPTARGPQDQSLYLDTAWIGPPNAQTVLVNTSGTHGAEGFAGSAAQLAWLNERGRSSLPPGVAMLMIHAVNPYGFAWGLRGTHDNIDLNRNWLDFSAPPPENELYEQIHPFLCPREIKPSTVNQLMEEGARMIAKHGRWALEDAISRGQYTHPDGFHYGGARADWSSSILQDIFQNDLSHIPHIGFIDWHTGPVGNGELIYLCFSSPKSRQWQEAQRWWGSDALDPAKVDRLWGSKRPSRVGIMYWGLEKLVEPAGQLVGGIVEFRSAQPKSNSVDALKISMLERWLRFEGGFDAPEAAHYLALLQNEYAPSRKSWRDTVLQNGLMTYDQTLAGLGSWDLAQAAD
ncbi:MAG: M14 family metallopeptidase [Parvibaculaceae bacterium]|nr:M14 family metallopeptidase [Parvibaculaceae bacterium]